MTVKPISPSEVIATKLKHLPDEVIEAFNEMIARNFTGRSSTFSQKDVCELIVSKSVCDRRDIFDKGWLDVEGLYRAYGWKVEYDKPGFNESYSAYFIFSKKHGKEL